MQERHLEKFNNCFKVVHNEVRVRTVQSSLAWPDISRTLWLGTITACPPSHYLMRDLRAQKASGQYFGWVAVTSRLEQAVIEEYVSLVSTGSWQLDLLSSAQLFGSPQTQWWASPKVNDRPETLQREYGETLMT